MHVPYTKQNRDDISTLRVFLEFWYTFLHKNLQSCQWAVYIHVKAISLLFITEMWNNNLYFCMSVKILFEKYVMDFTM